MLEYLGLQSILQLLLLLRKIWVRLYCKNLIAKGDITKGRKQEKGLQWVGAVT